MARLATAQIRHTCWRHPIWPKRWDTLRPTMDLISAKQRGSLVSPTSIVVAPCWWHWHCLSRCRNNHLRCPWLLRQPLLVVTVTHRHCPSIIWSCTKCNFIVFWTSYVWHLLQWVKLNTSLLKFVPAALDLHRSNDKHLASYLGDETYSAWYLDDEIKSCQLEKSSSSQHHTFLSFVFLFCPIT